MTGIANRECRISNFKLQEPRQGSIGASTDRLLQICNLQFAFRNLKFLLLLAVLAPAAAFADGTEFSARGHDLVLNVDTRWTGGSFGGGYYPIRIRVTNRGPARNLTFRFKPNAEGLPAATRTIGAEQNATMQFTLSVPLVGNGNYGELQVIHDGRVLTGLGRSLTLPDLDYSAQHRSSMLIISPNAVDSSQFAAATDAIVTRALSGSYSYGYGGYSGGSADVQTVPPAMLPDAWLDYSALDIVAISLDTLDKLPRDSRTALVDWVDCGGTLLVYNVGKPAAESDELRRLMGFDSRAHVSDWQKAVTAQRQAVAVAPAAQSGVAVEAAADPSPESTAAQPMHEFTWPDSRDAFAWRDVMLGRVYAFETSPFPGTPSDWNWFLNSLGPDRYKWGMRNGFSSRVEDDEFLNFLIPNVKGVPILAFLGLITLFTVIIGPLNYFLAWKRKRLYVLVLTIPAIALVTSLTLFSYSAIAHGFGVKSRARSLTVLDQPNKTAVSISRITLFAGLAPSEGLQFSPQTAVFPIWRPGELFKTGSVDWTEAQSLQSGWLRSRTRTQFVTVSHRPARGRLGVEPDGDKLKVENGFEWPLDRLIVADAEGRLYAGAGIPAGASTRLEPMAPDEATAFRAVLNRHPLQMPPGVTDPYSYSTYRTGGMYYSGHYEQPQTSFGTGQLETHLRNFGALGTAANEKVLGRSSYVAIFGENPGIELGVEKTKPDSDLHVLLGRY